MLFRSATVIDGTGDARYRADVRVSGEVIDQVAPPGQLEAHHQEVVVASDELVLAPGFVDMHAHSDLEVLRPGPLEAKVLQGVTTEVNGQDGLSYAPVDEASLSDIRTRIAGWHGELADEQFTWRDVAGYLDRLDEGGPLNSAYLVPQGNLRMLAVGHGSRQASRAEVDQMRELLRTGMQSGAFGMSSGLTYAPGMHATTAELESLCEVVAECGGYWSPHTRGYGRGALNAYQEVIEISRRTGCPVHLTHATMNFPSNRGRAEELLRRVDDAVASGVDVTLDSYPYLAGATTLASLLPSWSTAGGLDATLQRLRDPTLFEQIRHEIEVVGSDGAHHEPIDWRTIQVSGVTEPSVEDCVGRTIQELAEGPRASLGGAETAGEVFRELLRIDQLRTGILMHVGDVRNMEAIMRHPRHMGGSDGILVGGRPHPRGWGAFATYLSAYARERSMLSLEEWVRHLSGAPARRLRLSDRGEIREGAIADLVLFDPLTIRAEASYDAPRKCATGVSTVLIAGVPVVEGGRPTNARPGKALRHSAR